MAIRKRIKAGTAHRLSLDLSQTIRILEDVRTCIAVAILALEHQAADYDVDIAGALRRGAVLPLEAEIGRLRTP